MHEGAAPRIERGSRGSPEIIHAHLRAKVLSGEHPAGFELSQAQVAKSFGVSRGPVREAFRLLQRDGLIESEVNHRARVTSLSLQDVEHLYTLRIVNEALALTVSVPRFTADELDELDRLVDEVDASHGHGFEVWENAHQRFHRLLLTHAGERMLHSLALWADHTERYRRVYVGDDAGSTSGAAEHAHLAWACRGRDAAAATTLLARHLSRAALSLVAAMDPAHEPALLRAAIRQASSSGPVEDGRAMHRSQLQGP